MQQEFEAYVSTLVGGDGESEAAARTKRQQLPKAVEDNKPKQQLQSIQITETDVVPSEVDTTNYDATEKCLHGLPAQKVLANKLYKVFVDKFRDEYSAKAAVADNTLEECFQAAIDATGEQYGNVWIESIYLEMIVSFLIHEGTQDILSKRGVAARTCAAIANFFEQWVAMSLRKVQFGWQWGRVYELYKADQHTLVSYFRNRINCKCLDDKHKEVRSIKKIGICCNPLCPLPERKLERGATMSCDHCKLVTYCSLACQKNDWKRHKQPCLDCVAKKGVFNYEQLLHAHSLWVDASAAHLKTQQEHAQVIMIYNRLSQEIQRDLTFVQQHANQEIGKARIDWERRQQDLYTRKQLLGEEKAFVHIVCNDSQ